MTARTVGERSLKLRLVSALYLGALLALDALILFLVVADRQHGDELVAQTGMARFLLGLPATAVLLALLVIPWGVRRPDPGPVAGTRGGWPDRRVTGTVLVLSWAVAALLPLLLVFPVF